MMIVIDMPAILRQKSEVRTQLFREQRKGSAVVRNSRVVAEAGCIEQEMPNVVAEWQVHQLCTNMFNVHR